MLKAKSNAKKQDLGLTISRASRDARRIVDKMMPGVNATIESRTGYDLAGDFATVVTTITFPLDHPARHLLVVNLAAIDEDATIVDTCSRIVITRKR